MRATDWKSVLAFTTVLVTASALATAPASAQAIPAAVGAAEPRPNAQSGDPGEPFGGYVGYVGPDGTAPVVDESKPKPDGPGQIRSSENHGPDVPGAKVKAEPEHFTTAIPKAVDPAQVAAVRKAVAGAGSARVIVMVRARVGLEGDLSNAEVRSQRRTIADSLDGLAETLAGTGSRRVQELKAVPSAVYRITRPGLAALLADPNVVSVTLDHQADGELDSSTGVIDSDLLNAAGVLGNGFDGSPVPAYEVAIIDSGVDSGHNAFLGRIVRQACFVTDSSCPGGTNSSVGAPSGEECTHSSDCDHGTHVGGIAAGAPYTNGHEGVARGANLVAIKVAQDNPNSARWTAFFSSINNALQHVINLKNGTNPDLVSVNLSIGGSLFPNDGSCNTALPTTNSLFGQLQSLGVAVVVAAGNDGSTTQMSAPGCLSNAFAIGATDDSDVPASFTNSSSGLRWWAPGVSIDAPVPTGTNEGNKSGTSMAAPHVAGAFALLRECVDGNGIPQSNAAAAADLDATGVNVTRAGVTRKRINVLDAATRNVNNNDFAAAETIPSTPFNDFDFNICADSEAGEPGPFSLDNSVWWNWTAPAVGTATISTEDGGGNVTTFDTTLTVYTGDTLATLTPVAFDDDAGTGLRSLVTFPVNAGDVFRIKVDGFGAANGLLNLHIELGPPPQCFGVAATLVGRTAGETINGTAGNDVVVAGDGADTINSGDGNDRICAGTGDDTVNSGNGADFVLGDPGADTINGDADNDVLVGNAGGGDTNDVGDTINGGTGNDSLDGWVGEDVLRGGDGNDTLTGAADDDILLGGLGNDAIEGGSEVDVASFADSPAAVTATLTANFATGEGSDTLATLENLTGSAHNDILVGDGSVNVLYGANGNDGLDGRAGNDQLLGANGDDLLLGRPGNDTVDGGPNTDTASFAASLTPVTANLTTGVATGDGNDTLALTENLTGTAGNDLLVGNAGPNVLTGNDGNDFLEGMSGNDLLLGGIGNDILRGRLGNDTVNGGANVDTASFAASATAVSADLTAGAATGEGSDTLTATENLTGTAGNDLLVGNAGPNVLTGNDGNDFLEGMSGNDLLLGGNGNDILRGRLGNDTVNGGPNVDTASFAASATAVSANLTAGTATGEGNDTLAETENLTGSAANDTLVGNALRNILTGNNGNDILRGLAGNDHLVGSAGADRCEGGVGADTQATCEVLVGIP